MAVCKPQTYIQAAEVHLSKDEKVEWNTVTPTIQLMNRTAKAIVRMFCVGKETSSNQRERILKAVTTPETSPTTVSCLWKTHKVHNGVPPTRPSVIPVRLPTREQKKRMVALTLNCVARTLYTNHIYKFNGDVYRQLKGGPIGDDYTNKCAGIVMYTFISRYKQRLARLHLLEQTVLLKVYVDDCNQAGAKLPYGTQYAGGKLYLPGEGWRGRSPPGQTLKPEEKKDTQGIAEEMNARERTQGDEDKHTASIYRMIANSCLPNSIKMKEDTCFHHGNGRLPILDTEMWMEGGKIVHSHYSKPMASMEVLLARSAMSLASKMDILVQEGGRRIRNCSLDLDWNQVIPFINKLMISMFWAKYPEEVRRMVGVRIMARRNTNLKNLEDLGRPLYRDKATRRAVPKKDKATWFRGSGATATIMVPTTPGSALAKGIRTLLLQAGGPIGTQTKVLEHPGSNIHQGISPNNPFPRT